MSPLSVTAEEFLREARREGFDGACIDVRSEGEAQEGSILGFVNLPILNQDERHQVGLAYKTLGQEEAIRLGHELVSGPVKRARIESWATAIDRAPGRIGYVACWRGGLRSRTACEWIRESDREAISVQGGYKAIRRVLMRPFTQPLILSPPVLVLSGLTGAGKTGLLRRLGSEGLPWIDLEGHARHRGSSFGLRIGDRQPPQATFENALAWDFYRLERGNAPCLWVEDESRNVGNRIIPDSLKNAMSVAPIVLLDAPIQKRCANIFREYVLLPLDSGIAPPEVRQSMLNSALALRRKLGGAVCDEVLRDINDAFGRVGSGPESHYVWIRKLLEHYYDKTYRFALERQPREVLFRGDESACRQWMLERSA